MYDRGIEAFLSVASCRSISGAAKMLNLTSSAISHRLRNLEDELNMTLIDRQKGVRRSELTLAGEKFFPIAERWNNLFRETQLIKSNSEDLSLSIGCVDSVNTYIMPPLYKALSNHTPTVYPKIYVYPSIAGYEKIETRVIDVAFVVQKVWNQNLNVTRFYSEEMKVIRLRQCEKTSPTVKAIDLDPKYEFFIEWNPAHVIWHNRIWDPAIKAKIQLDTVTLIQALMDDPRQWAIIPNSVVDYFKVDENLIVQNLDPAPPDRITYMVTQRFPRPGAYHGIKILQNLAERMGFY